MRITLSIPEEKNKEIVKGINQLKKQGKIPMDTSKSKFITDSAINEIKKHG